MDISNIDNHNDKRVIIKDNSYTDKKSDTSKASDPSMFSDDYSVKHTKKQTKNNKSSILKQSKTHSKSNDPGMFEESSYVNHNGKLQFSPKKLAEVLAKDIYSKNEYGLPKTAKYIDKYVPLINKDNVEDVCNAYKNSTNETLMEAIISERGLPPEDRAKYLKHISDALLKSAKAKGIYVDDLSKDINKEIDYQMKKVGIANADFINSFINKLNNRTVSKLDASKVSLYSPNGKIDKPSFQGNTGDCWLLATINGLARTEKGRQILNDSLRVDKSGNVYVKLRGAEKTYKISPQELKGSNNFSAGDLDVRAIEIAVDRYFKENRGVTNWALFIPNTRIDTNGNFSDNAFQLIVGRGKRNLLSNSSFGRILDAWFTDKQIDGFNKPNNVIVVGTVIKNKDITLKLADNTTQELLANHAYTVAGSDKDSVFLVDPRDSSKTIAVLRKDFKKFFNCLDEIEL